MFYEYALEPAVLSSWDRTRFFLDAFGPWKGRFLAKYPSTWKKMVYRSLSSCPDVEKKRIIERLRGAKESIFSPRKNASYDGHKPWLENARAEHDRAPFHAIIAKAPPSAPHLLDGEAIDDQSARWRVESGRWLERDPAMIVEALGLLLRASQRVIIIDPYFRADQGDKLSSLTALWTVLGPGVAVEIHSSSAKLSYSETMRHAERALPRNLPPGVRVTWHCWAPKEEDQRFHNRFILTDIGGVQFGDSIEKGEPGQVDRLSILDEPSRSKLWEQYLGASPAFDRAGESREFVGAEIATR